MTREEFLAAGEQIGGLEGKVDTGFKEMWDGFRAVSEILDTVLHEVRQIRVTDLERRVAAFERHIGLAR